MLRRLVIGVFLAIASFAFVLAWHSSLAAQACVVSTAEADGEILQLRKRLAALEAARVREERTKVAVKSDLKKPTLKEMETEVAEESQRKNDEYHDKLLDTPHLQVLYEQHMRAWYSEIFTALFHQLKLSPEQRERFVAALVKASVQQQDLEAVAKAKGLSRNDPEWKKQRAAVDEESVRTIEELLGPDALTVTREYTRLDAARSYLASYAGLFSRLGQPLTAEQLEALTTACAKASPKQGLDLAKFTSAQWDQIWTEAERVLTPGQWRDFQAITPPGQFVGRWETAVQEILTKTAGPGP